MKSSIAQGSFSAKSAPAHCPPVKPAYTREREYLRPHEVEALIKAARHAGRHGLRDATEEEVISTLSPYLTKHINRFGSYSLDLDRQPPSLEFGFPLVSDS